MRLITSKTLYLVFSLVLVIMGCRKSESSSPASNNQVVAPKQSAMSPVAQTATSPVLAESPIPAQQRVDVCSLLTAEEIKSVQGEVFTDTKASESAEKGIAISQCFFSLPTFTNSVS